MEGFEAEALFFMFEDADWKGSIQSDPERCKSELSEEAFSYLSSLVVQENSVNNLDTNTKN
jgi:hypothetical protein